MFGLKTDNCVIVTLDRNEVSLISVEGVAEKSHFIILSSLVVLTKSSNNPSLTQLRIPSLLN